MNDPVSALARTKLAHAIDQGDRLDQLTLELYERYRADLEEEIRTSTGLNREKATRTLGALGHRSLTELSFASAASWTVWATDASDATVKADWARHQPVVKSYLEANATNLPTDVVFVALNWGVRAGMPIDDWANFHGGSRDYFLADAIRGHVSEDGSVVEREPLPRFRGVYITDFFKGLPTSDGGALKRTAGDDLEELEELSGDLLVRELALLGATSETMLIPLGGAARDVVIPFCDERQFLTPRDESGVPLEVDHYSYVQKHASFYNKLAYAHAAVPDR